MQGFETGARVLGKIDGVVCDPAEGIQRRDRLTILERQEQGRGEEGMRAAPQQIAAIGQIGVVLQYGLQVIALHGASPPAL